jgi:peptidoglycan L-alanyl-D-glutamate endopeptidase CwlK
MLVYLKDSEVTEELGKLAKTALAELYPKDIGATLQLRTSDGRTYIARLERHYHPPGGALRPWGPHKGISILRETESAQPSGEKRPAAYKLGKVSLSRLEGVDRRLVAVVKHAIEITPIDFTVVEGLRSRERQAQLLKQGLTQTMNSRHLTGHAVDLAPWVGGAISWQWDDFNALAPAVLAAAKHLDVPIEWGGNWRSFRDGPHWQIPWGK